MKQLQVERRGLRRELGRGFRRPGGALVLLVLATTIVGLESGRAETVSAQRIAASRRIIPLQKITVGPDDQYQAVVSPDGKSIVFTRKSELAPHLCIQDLKTGKVRDLMPVTADSQEPAFSPSGALAFTYFKFHARGDICYKPAAELEQEGDGAVVCLKNRDGDLSSPFWKSEKELGYLFRDPRSQEAEIAVTNIETGVTEVLARGKIWHPSLRPGGRQLVYSELLGSDLQDESGRVRQGQRVVRVKDLETGTVSTLELELSGIPGFASLSPDERFITFGHYLNDTNRDGIIDGSDNAVVFRLPLEALRRGKVFPEQLTSVETNCSFPHPVPGELYLTCAFEGSLDIYRLPATGIVPADWSKETLLNAHQTARSYAERILLLNTLRSRFGESSWNHLARVFSNHWLSEDMAASRFYLERLRSDAPAARKGMLDLLRILVEAREQKMLQPVNEITRAFQMAIERLDADVAKVAGPERLKVLVRGFLKSFLNQEARAADLIRKLRWDAPADPVLGSLELMLFHQLASSVYVSTGRHEDLLTAYRQLISARELSEESRLFYGFSLLKYLAARNADPSARLMLIQDFLRPGLPEDSATLLKAELATLKIIQAPPQNGEKEDPKTIAYRELDQLMSATRSDYFLRKALSVRAILNFADAREFKYLTFVATNWLRFTVQDDTEFAFAREVFGNASLDRAYDTFALGQYRLAENYFYGSLSLTDDLESHAGFVRAMVAQNQRAAIDARYENLVERRQVEDNLHYARALLAILDANPSATDGTDAFDRAISALERVETDRESPVRYLLLGYCHLEKFLRTAKGYDFDRQLAEEANRTLMLAYDLGREQVRLRSAALINLGLLHQRIQNHGLAARFLGMRQELDRKYGSISTEEKVRTSWLYARSLYYTNQPVRAAEVLGHALSAVGEAKGAPAASKGPLLERLAFYQLAAGAYAEAALTYQSLLGGAAQAGAPEAVKSAVSPETSSTAGRDPRVLLGYGFTLFKLQRGVESRRILQQAISLARQLRVKDPEGAQLIAFDPRRIELDALGLLARIPAAESGAAAAPLTGPIEDPRVEALEQRIALLSSAQKLYSDSTALLALAHVQLAGLITPRNLARAAREMNRALEFALELQESGAIISKAVFQTQVDYLVHGILHPAPYSPHDHRTIGQMLEKTFKGYDEQKIRQPVLAYQRKKLELLWAKYQRRVMQVGLPGGAGAGSGEVDLKAGLEDVAPPLLSELKALAQALRNL